MGLNRAGCPGRSAETARGPSPGRAGKTRYSGMPARSSNGRQTKPLRQPRDWVHKIIVRFTDGSTQVCPFGMPLTDFHAILQAPGHGRIVSEPIDHVIPYSFGCPSDKSDIDLSPCPSLTRQIAPECVIGGDPKHGLDKRACAVLVRAGTRLCFPRKAGNNRLPLSIADPMKTRRELIPIFDFTVHFNTKETMASFTCTLTLFREHLSLQTRPSTKPWTHKTSRRDRDSDISPLQIQI